MPGVARRLPYRPQTSRFSIGPDAESFRSTGSRYRLPALENQLGIEHARRDSSPIRWRVGHCCHYDHVLFWIRHWTNSTRIPCASIFAHSWPQFGNQHDREAHNFTHCRINACISAGACQPQTVAKGEKARRSCIFRTHRCPADFAAYCADELSGLIKQAMANRPATKRGPTGIFVSLRSAGPQGRAITDYGTTAYQCLKTPTAIAG
jgi:hypothetical protein